MLDLATLLGRQRPRLRGGGQARQGGAACGRGAGGAWRLPRMARPCSAGAAAVCRNAHWRHVPVRHRAVRCCTARTMSGSAWRVQHSAPCSPTCWLAHMRAGRLCCWACAAGQQFEVRVRVVRGVQAAVSASAGSQGGQHSHGTCGGACRHVVGGAGGWVPGKTGPEGGCTTARAYKGAAAACCPHLTARSSNWLPQAGALVLGGPQQPAVLPTRSIPPVLSEHQANAGRSEKGGR